MSNEAVRVKKRNYIASRISTYPVKLHRGDKIYESWKICRKYCDNYGCWYCN